MKAIIYRKYGGPDQLQLEDIPKPVQRKNEVLIKIHTASINSWDWDLLKGKPFLVRLLGGLSKPKHQVLGADIAGIVESVGTDVKSFKSGDAVFGDIAGAGFGGFAEYVSVPEKLLAKIPEGISFEQAACLPQAGLLAMQGLRYKRALKSGQHLLINGAGGAVGTLALLYAKHIGAIVTCVDKEEKFEILRSLGADHLIDYRKQDYTTMELQYDYILDVIAHRSAASYQRALKPSGVFAMIGGSMGGLLIRMMLFQPLLSLFSRKKMGIMGYRVSREGLEELAALCTKGIMIPVIDKTFALSETDEAFRYYEKGNFKGKILIKIA
ncbi:MAG TPA: NAD(P)-dependent alcohol dehydrogenase [Chitinophagaceae bacterium]|jgi:NADPH:quinone reductase-like Zn-dependent oxidoreductase|nr:NAD(P)-dependent alcohol dehydrogenase [Chitinophagaceae bacterium]